MCTNPIKITVNKEEITVKCGKCDTCRRQRQQEWAIKLINEAKYHTKACFITLTFDNKILLDKNSIARKKYGAHPGFIFNITESKKYFTKFMKRLRKHFNEKRITYYKIGEYGEIKKRPHYHCILFGINFEEDRKKMPLSKTGHEQYHSDTLQKIWACGRISIQDINSANIIYISQYSLKKFKNNQENKFYKPTQSFSNRSKMSCKWARRNYAEIVKGYIEDGDGKRYRIPRSYINNLKKSEKKIHRRAVEEYENNILENIANKSNNDIIKQEKIKEKILKQREMQNVKKRDF